MKVFLTGCSGFVGTHLLRRLGAEGHQVRALVHRAGVLRQQQPVAYRVEEVRGDISAGDIANVMAGCDAVINLVGIIYERGPLTFEAIHHQGTRNLVKAAKQARWLTPTIFIWSRTNICEPS